MPSARPPEMSAALRPAALLLVLAAPARASAARIDELTETRLFQQAVEFLTLADPVVRTALAGSLLLGVCCGLLGSFMVVRRLSLAGDAIAHAVLPGIVLGFFWTLTKNPLALFIGAVLAGLAGAFVLGLIRDSTHLKEDTALGLVLSGFYAVGIVGLTMLQNHPLSGQSGLETFLFGQAAALSPDDVRLMAVVTGLSLLIVLLLYKELLASSFDPGFSRCLGLPVKLLHHLVMVLLTFAVVVSLQAVGAVLVAAMIITPAATAYLLTDRFHRMIFYSCLLGAASGGLGVFLSYLGNRLPTGPFIVLAASCFFGLAFTFAPRHGLLHRTYRLRTRRTTIALENALKTVYRIREDKGFSEEGVPVGELQARLGEPDAVFTKLLRALTARQWATWAPGDTHVFLTPAGWLRACAVVRNHRLWELYLTHAADYPPDHVHDDAEVIEHILGEDTVRQLERRLDFPDTDPHGRLIPSLGDLQQSLGVHPARPRAEGYDMPR
ncbi:MAG: ABC transporter [Puniceicoccaceae bacterium]|nr:MAG: ABC transporter [Puniceicoccaceae bacterium]